MNRGAIFRSFVGRRRTFVAVVSPYSFLVHQTSRPAATHRMLIERSFATAPENGENAYQGFLGIQEQMKQLRQEQERAKSEKMYQAWMRAEEKGKKDSDGDDRKHQKNASIGVQVVRTLVKEQRKKKSTEVQLEDLQNLALAKLKKAADKGHPSALVQLGNSLLGSDPQKAFDYYRMAGEKGSAEGWFNLGHCLWEGMVTPSSWNGEAMNAFRKAIDLGDTDAMYFVGVHYLSQVDHDEELTINNDEEHLRERLKLGLELIEKAAAAKHGGALHYLALFYLNGHIALQVPPCSEEAFVQRLDSAIEHDGSGDALFLRGSCLFNGDTGYERDAEAALLDFLKAADLGNAEAAVSAGAILHKGMPPKIPKDQQRAFALYQHAGELGSEDGWRNVVACYATGEGVPQCEKTAKHIANTMFKEK